MGTNERSRPEDLLARYHDGDHERVWHELRQMGAAVRQPEHHPIALAVVREAMERARQNVVTLIERLRAQGYVFGDPHEMERAREPLSPPDEHTPEFVEWLERRFGPIPMTARAWIETVGDVNLLGVHPAWSKEHVVDPLVVEFEYKSWSWAASDSLAARHNFENERESYEFNLSDGGGELAGQFALPVAPDALHKANFSGGAPYGVLVPDGSADGTFRFDDGLLLPFVEYLRLTFRSGGFPGLWHRPISDAGHRARRELADGLLDL